MLKIVAIYKFFNGAEWMQTSVEAIRGFADKIIISIPQSNWNGTGRPEECPVESAPDIEIYKSLLTRQEEVYQELVEKADEHKPDYRMAVDADEVWEKDMLEKAQFQICNGYISYDNIYFCDMFSYIRSPFYRVMDTNQPTVFVKAGVPYTNIRWVGGARVRLPGVNFHHFSAVRESLEKVMQKFDISNTAEKMARPDWEVWVKEVWARLPHAENVNPNVTLRHIWPKVEVVGPGDLPAVCLKNPLVQAFQAYKPARSYDPKAITPELKAKFNLPEDFGPNHAWFTQPSYRYRWIQMLESL